MRTLLRLALLLIAVHLLVAAALPAQEIVFCLDHTKDGTPLARAKNFELESFGQELALVYRSRDVIRTGKLYFFIDLWREEAFSEYDTKSTVPKPGTNWTSVRYQFDKSGKYRVVVLDAEKREICQDIVEVNVREEENSPAYFEGAQVVFCNQAPSGIADTSYREFRLRTGTAKDFAILVHHDRPLGTNRILVDVWLGGGKSAGLYLETIEFQVEPQWNYTQFNYVVNGAGVYTFRVYNENEVWISSGALEVMME
ncbi:MAG: hypothetical protein AAF998_12140 [Bacteroidota bacterium]